MESEHLVAPFVIPVDVKLSTFFIGGGFQEPRTEPFGVQTRVATHSVRLVSHVLWVCEGFW